MAGFFDGEGCVSLAKNKSDSAKRGFTFALQVSLSQKTKPILDEIQETYNGSVSEDKSSNGYHWQVYGINAKRFLEDIVEFSKVKKQEIEFAIEYCNMFHDKPRNKLSDLEYEVQEAYHNALKKLKEK